MFIFFRTTGLASSESPGHEGTNNVGPWANGLTFDWGARSPGNSSARAAHAGETGDCSGLPSVGREYRPRKGAA